jgi:hypothetical protein
MEIIVTFRCGYNHYAKHWIMTLFKLLEKATKKLTNVTISEQESSYDFALNKSIFLVHTQIFDSSSNTWCTLRYDIDWITSYLWIPDILFQISNHIKCLKTLHLLGTLFGKIKTKVMMANGQLRNNFSINFIKY